MIPGEVITALTASGAFTSVYEAPTSTLGFGFSLQESFAAVGSTAFDGYFFETHAEKNLSEPYAVYRTDGVGPITISGHQIAIVETYNVVIRGNNLTETQAKTTALMDGLAGASFSALLVDRASGNYEPEFQWFPYELEIQVAKPVVGDLPAAAVYPMGADYSEPSDTCCDQSGDEMFGVSVLVDGDPETAIIAARDALICLDIDTQIGSRVEIVSEKPQESYGGLSHWIITCRHFTRIRES